MDYEELYELIQVARGIEPAELVLKNAEIINVFTGAFEIADIAIHHGIIAGVGRYKGLYEKDIQRSIAVPGFIDAHMHLETSMLTPEELTMELIKHGTTTAIIDPHEIANVAGLEGMDYLLKSTRDLPVDFFFMAPPSVPSTPPDIETTGSSVSEAEIRMLLSNPEYIGLGEVMDVSGVLSGRPETLGKILTAHGRPIDGHAPGLKGKRLNAYIVSGPTSDHETTELGEAIEKIGRGMFLMIRESSVSKNLNALLPAVNYFTSRYMTLITDDLSITDIRDKGHLDYIVRSAISKGADIRLILQMVTLNPALHYGLNDRGAIVPGRIADILILEDITEVYIRTVIKNGIIVYDVGHTLHYVEKREPSVGLKNSIYVNAVKPEHFALPARGRRVRVIKVDPQSIVTAEEIITAPIADGFVTSDHNQDILKIAVINRYKRDVSLAVGLVHGLGLKSGAMASSVSHDAHNIVVAGVDDNDIAVAVNAIIEMQGGVAIAESGKVVASLPLRIAGLISEETSEDVYKKLDELNKKARELGSRLNNPFMTLSFITLATVPKLKITDKGLVDTTIGELVNLFVA
ncbi:MAG: adenine deaminase [Actinomycetota bacterium]